MENKFGISIKWLSVTGFELRCGDLTVVTDPFVTASESTDLTWEAIENCDILCLTHAHFDHITDIPALTARFKPLILCGDQTALPLTQWLNYTPSRVYPMYPDTELDFDAVKIRALYGRHTDQKRDLDDLCAYINAFPICAQDEGIRSLQLLGSFEYRNYLFTLPNGTTVLLWGNDPTTEQMNICKMLKPDIAIIQRSVDAENLEKKAKFAAAIGCKIVIPHHHDLPTGHEKAVIDMMRAAFAKHAPDTSFIAPNHGEWLHL